MLGVCAFGNDHALLRWRVPVSVVRMLRYCWEQLRPKYHVAHFESARRQGHSWYQNLRIRNDRLQTRQSNLRLVSARNKSHGFAKRIDLTSPENKIWIVNTDRCGGKRLFTLVTLGKGLSNYRIFSVRPSLPLYRLIITISVFKTF